MYISHYINLDKEYIKKINLSQNSMKKLKQKRKKPMFVSYKKKKVLTNKTKNCFNLLSSEHCQPPRRRPSRQNRCHGSECGWYKWRDAERKCRPL